MRLLIVAVAYGILFGVYPTIIAETFGINCLSQNWGIMTLSPIVFGNIFNIIYGRVYDAHSAILPDGSRDCPDGLYCYSAAYWVTFGGALLGVMLSVWSIRHDHVTKHKARKEARGRDLAREA